MNSKELTPEFAKLTVQVEAKGRLNPLSLLNGIGQTIAVIDRLYTQLVLIFSEKMDIALEYEQLATQTIELGSKNILDSIHNQAILNQSQLGNLESELLKWKKSSKSPFETILIQILFDPESGTAIQLANPREIYASTYYEEHVPQLMTWLESASNRLNVISTTISEAGEDERTHKNNYLYLLQFNKSLLAGIDVEPLYVESIHYGSPITIELIGISKILEFIEHSVKQLKWQGKHEQHMAEHERNKAMLEEEALRVGIIQSKIEVIKSIQALDIPRQEKQKLTRVVMTNLSEIGNSVDSLKIVKFK